jgi:Trk-type K+ transport system membrane component
MWFGPFALMWVMFVVPVALTPQWIHPKLCDRDRAKRYWDRKEFRRFVGFILVATWLAASAVATAVGSNWAGWVFLGTEVFFGSLLFTAVRARVARARQVRDEKRTFDRMVGGF